MAANSGKTKPKRRGRPPGNAKGNTPARAVRIDEQRWLHYQTVAQEDGLTLSEWLRRAADYVAGNPVLRRQLSKGKR